MKQILLIAWREYRQYVFSRGFLIFLFMFPLGFIGVSAAIGVAERTKPIRYYAVHDETGVYRAEILGHLERSHMYAVLESVDTYLRLNLGEKADALPAPFAPANIDERRLAEFAAAGGVTSALAAARPTLSSNAPAYVPPKLPYALADLPEDAATTSGKLEDIEAALRPYLLEEKSIDTPEGPRPLFAAILIPEDFAAGENAPAAQYWSRHITDTELQSRVSAALTNAELGVLSQDKADLIGQSSFKLFMKMV